MVRFSLVCLVGLCLTASAGAGTWADGLFDELSKDFGSVPRGPAQKHQFRLVNKTNQVVNISNIRVSCGCISAQAPKALIQPGEEAFILMQMDTTRFIGPKQFTIYVQFDRPNFDEARIWIQTNFRNDFQITPDTLAFGQVKRGTTPSSKVQVTFYGNREAKVLSIRGESNYVQPVLKEVTRDDGQVAYEVLVNLRGDTPVGKWYTDLWMKTNLPTMEQVRIPLTVEIESPLSVSPSIVAMGDIKQGEENVRRIIVRGVKPFVIKEIRGTDSTLNAVPNSKEPREVHVLAVKVKSEKPGPIARSLKIVTDLKADNEIDFSVQGQILAPTSNAPVGGQ
ncbi:MAG: DUF1573 domain-containing protein [Gemmataceae bacterium]